MVYFWTMVGRRLIWWDQLLLQDGNVKLMSMLGWMFLGVAAMGVVVITQKWYVQYWTKKRLLICTCLGTVKLKSWAWMSNTCQSWLSFLSITINLPAFIRFPVTLLGPICTLGWQEALWNIIILNCQRVWYRYLAWGWIWTCDSESCATIMQFNAITVRCMQLFSTSQECVHAKFKKCINACSISANIQPKFYVFGNVVNNLTQIWKLIFTRKGFCLRFEADLSLYKHLYNFCGTNVGHSWKNFEGNKQAQTIRSEKSDWISAKTLD